MSVIIRLQNLSWNAHALDIRQFFKGQSIPDGGVHIVGGDVGDAFIAFSTDEDARRAMMLNGEKLNGVPVKLFLSSKTEMQKVIALARGAPLDKDERPPMNSPPFSGPGPAPVSGGPYSQPPPSLPLHPPNSLSSMQATGASGPLIGNAGFNQPPFSSGLPPQRSMMSVRGGESAGHRFPLASNQTSRDQRFPQKFDTSPGMPQRPDIVRSERPDILKRGSSNGNRPERAGIVRYDKIEVGSKEIVDASHKLKPDILRDERREDRKRNRDDNFDRKDPPRNSRQDVDGRKENRDDRVDEENIREKRHCREEDRKTERSKRDEYRSRERLDEDRRSDDKTDRRGGDRETRQKPDDRRHRDRVRYDSRDREKRARHSRESDRRDNYQFGDRSRQHSEGRSRYGRGSEETFGDQQDPESCAFISQLPLTVSYKDVRRLFSREQIRLPESGLKLENDEYGNRNGNAFVKFLSREFREKAIELDGIYLEGSRIRVERCTLSDFERAVDSFVPQNNRRRGIEKMQGNFHGGMGDQPDVIPRSPIPAARGSKDFFETCCVMLRNLPSRVERFQVRQFFRSLNITPNGVYIPFDDKGACLGVAYVEFVTVPEAEEAMQRYDGTEFMNSKNLVDMYPITMEEAKERIDQHKNDFKKGPPVRNMFDRREKLDGRGDYRRDEHRSEERFRQNRSQEGYGGSRNEERFQGSRSEDGYQGGERYRRDRSEDSRVERRSTGRANGNEGYHPGNMPLDILPANSAADLMNEDTAVNQKFQCVKLRGLAFHADVGLVEGFFFDLSIRPNGIHVVFFPDTRCNGIAYVEFTNIDDCSKALQRDRTSLGKRVIRVSPVSEEDMVTELNAHKMNGQYVVSRATQEAPGQPCDVIMSNVPHNATMFDVTQFLHGTGFIPESVLFEVDQQGNAMGNVKVTFFNSQAAHRALLTLLKKTILGQIVTFKVL